MIFLLVIFASVAGLGIGIGVGYGAGRAAAAKGYASLRKENDRQSQRLHKATKALYKIAANSGAPELEAQIALDDINTDRLS